MTPAQFRSRMLRKFAFTKSWFTKHSKKDVLVLIDRRSGRVKEVRTLLKISADETAQFRASAVAGISGGDELIHVAEPGRYFDQVFYSDHEKLFTIEELGAEKRLAKMPFIKHRVAKSLQELFDSIELVPRDRIEDGVLQKNNKPIATAKQKTRKGPLPKLYLESKKAKKFWHLVNHDGRTALVRSGTLGKVGANRIIPSKTLPALIEKLRVQGFVEAEPG
jgi:hypothetical protein